MTLIIIISSSFVSGKNIMKRKPKVFRLFVIVAENRAGMVWVQPTWVPGELAQSCSGACAVRDLAAKLLRSSYYHSRNCSRN